jgi:hypothetical protein
LSLTLADEVDDWPLLTAGEAGDGAGPAHDAPGSIHPARPESGRQPGRRAGPGAGEKLRRVLPLQQQGFNSWARSSKRSRSGTTPTRVEIDLAPPHRQGGLAPDLQSKSGDTCTRSVHLAHHMWFSTWRHGPAGLPHAAGREVGGPTVAARGGWVRGEHVPVDFLSSQMNSPSVRGTAWAGAIPLVDFREPAGSLLAGAQRPRRLRPVCPRRTQARHGHRPQAGAACRRETTSARGGHYGGGAPGGKARAARGTVWQRTITSRESRDPSTSTLFDSPYPRFFFPMIRYWTKSSASRSTPRPPRP